MNRHPAGSVAAARPAQDQEVALRHVEAAWCGSPLPLGSAERALAANLPDADAVVDQDLPRIVDRRKVRAAGFFCAACFESVEVSDPDAPPTEDEIVDESTGDRWAQASSPSGRFRVVMGQRFGGLPRWWMRDGSTVVSSHQEEVTGAMVADSGECLIVRLLEGTEHEIRVFTTEGACRLRAVLLDEPVAIAFDPAEGGSVVAQLSWVPIEGTRPDLERRVYAWLLGPTTSTWTAQTRFMADNITIRGDQVSFRSSRYGTTVLRLADGFLVSDKLGRGSFARQPSYPGTVVNLPPATADRWLARPRGAEESGSVGPTRGRTDHQPRSRLQDAAAKIAFATVGEDVYVISDSPNGRYRVGWDDSAPGGTSGYRNAGRGRWIVLEGERVLAKGTLERPNDGAISDSGRFILTDWLFGDRLAGTFYAMGSDGTVLVAEPLGAKARTSTISRDGRYAAVATAANPSDPAWSLRLLVFDLDGRRRLWDASLPQQVVSIVIDTDREVIHMELAQGGRLDARLGDGHVDPAAYRALWFSTNPYLVVGVIADELAAASDPLDVEVAERWSQELDAAVRARAASLVAAQDAGLDPSRGFEAKAWRLRGDMAERLGRSADALDAYTRAVELDPRVGVRRRIAALGGRVAPAPTRRRDREPVVDEGRPYASEACPSCQVRLSPLPKAKKRCPSCGEPIFVRAGPDGQRHLLKADELAEHEAWWASVYADGWQRPGNGAAGRCHQDEYGEGQGVGHGRLWDRMDRQRRRRARLLNASDVPRSPGVYAWYRQGGAVYIGKADELHGRAWGDHMGNGASMGSSAFRRNVAERLGFGSSADIKDKRVRLSPIQLAEVRSWILRCSVAWIECRTIAEAVELEKAMKREWMPPLTKR